MLALIVMVLAPDHPAYIIHYRTYTIIILSLSLQAAQAQDFEPLQRYYVHWTPGFGCPQSILGNPVLGALHC